MGSGSVPAISRENWNVAAVYGSDNSEVVLAASVLRRYGIAVEALYGPASRKGLKKRRAFAHRFEVVVDLDLGLVKDMILGGKMRIGASLVAAVFAALDGLEVGPSPSSGGIG